MEIRRIAALIIAAAMFPALTRGGTVEVKVLPWMGHKAAASLTFDGGGPDLLDKALPELDRRGMRATFFMTANRIERKDDWRKALSNGHEIGSGTLDGRHAVVLTASEEEGQVVGARNVLQKEFGVPVRTFAYPFGEVSPGLKRWAGMKHFLARAGEGKDWPVGRDGAPDWLEVPSRGLTAGSQVRVYRKWAAEASREGGWLLWRFREIGDGEGPEVLPLDQFSRVLDELASRDIWVGTFLEVGAYFRAQEILRNVVPRTVPNGERWDWTLPDDFPAAVVLKVTVRGSKDPSWKGEVWQGKRRVRPDANGVWKIDFGAKEMEVRSREK